MVNDKCPDCGVPLDETSFKSCVYHLANEADAQDAERLMLLGRSWSEKIEGCADFDEMKEHLAEYFRSIDQ